MDDTVGIGDLACVGGNRGLNDNRAVGYTGHEIVDINRTRSEILSQHLLTRTAGSSHFLLVVEVTEARGLVDIVVHRHLGLDRGLQVGIAILGQEVAAHLRIGIESAHEVGGRGIVSHTHRDGTCTVETDLVINAQHGHSLQVIDSGTVEHFADGITTAAVNLDLLRVVEAHGTKFIISDLIHTILRNGDFHPFARCELG